MEAQKDNQKKTGEAKGKEDKDCEYKVLLYCLYNG